MSRKSTDATEPSQASSVCELYPLSIEQSVSPTSVRLSGQSRLHACASFLPNLGSSKKTGTSYTRRAWLIQAMNKILWILGVNLAISSEPSHSTCLLWIRNIYQNLPSFNRCDRTKNSDSFLAAVHIRCFILWAQLIWRQCLEKKRKDS